MGAVLRSRNSGGGSIFPFDEEFGYFICCMISLCPLLGTNPEIRNGKAL